jgi:hypothetical protein
MEVFDLEQDFHAVPDKRDLETQRQNTKILSLALSSLLPHSSLVVPANRTFYLHHGVYGSNVTSVIIQIDGRLEFRRDFHEHEDPLTMVDQRPKPCILLEDAWNVTLTSSRPAGQRGIIDGGGTDWWGLPGIGYLQLVEHRPFLLMANRSSDVVVEHLIFQDSPYYALLFQNVNGLTIRHVSVLNRRTQNPSHGLIDLTAFNTDGIDVSGHNVHIHDCEIWTQDDCIAVKDNYFGDGVSSNMLFERINASGLGFVIGSIGGTTVRNITFRDSYLYKSVKGIYLKFRELDPEKRGLFDNTGGLVENITFANITMEKPLWGIWLGPAQQSDARSLCHGNPCSLCWPMIPMAQCRPSKESIYKDIILKNILINNPQGSPGTIIGKDLRGLVFDNVITDWSSSSIIDLRQTFPSLQDEPFEIDPYVRQAVVGLFALLVVSCFLCACIGIRWGSQRTNGYLYSLMDSGQVDNDNDERRHHQQRTRSEEKKKLSPIQIKQRHLRRCVLLSILIIVYGVIGSWSIYIWTGLTNVNDYYVCRGVSGGVALGKTWPVPSCLRDETSTNRTAQTLHHHHLVLVLFCCSLLVTIGLLYLHFLKGASQNKTFYRKGSDCTSLPSFSEVDDIDEGGSSSSLSLMNASPTPETEFADPLGDPAASPANHS